MNFIETSRASYRPQNITTLFVGESAPVSGEFFYQGKTALRRYMEKALSFDSFESFKARGWYLDDLVLTPVNGLSKTERRLQCEGAVTSLAARIAEYRPQAIVSLMKGIEPLVNAAAKRAESDAPCFSVPFPGQGQQRKFLREMEKILPMLPRIVKP